MSPTPEDLTIIKDDMIAFIEGHGMSLSLIHISDAAVDRLRHLPFEDLGFAKVDHHRSLRAGMPLSLIHI